MARRDPHSYADTDQPQTRSVELSLGVDSPSRTLAGEHGVRFREGGGGPVDLDTRDLRIGSVASLDGQPLKFELAAPEPILGSRLRIELPAESPGVRVRYATSPEASALQWLSPAQTRGGAPPVLYSQGQPIHAPPTPPPEDTPSRRITGGRSTV